MALQEILRPYTRSPAIRPRTRLGSCVILILCITGPSFDQEALFERLWRYHVRGWTFYKTRLTESYTYSDFLGDCPADALQIMVLKGDGRLLLHSPQTEREPEPGDTVVYYGPERGAPRVDRPAAGATTGE